MHARAHTLAASGRCVAFGPSEDERLGTRWCRSGERGGSAPPKVACIPRFQLFHGPVPRSPLRSGGNEKAWHVGDVSPPEYWSFFFTDTPRRPPAHWSLLHVCVRSARILTVKMCRKIRHQTVGGVGPAGSLVHVARVAWRGRQTNAADVLIYVAPL